MDKLAYLAKVKGANDNKKFFVVILVRELGNA